MDALQGRDPEQHLTEDEVSSRVRGHLENTGWTIKTWALAARGEHGDDITAERNGRLLVIEVKGEGSSQPHTKRFGRTFTSSQVTTHVSVAVYKAMQALSRGAEAGIALPDNLYHRKAAGSIQTALNHLGVSIYWIDRYGNVTVEGRDAG